jgi:spore cortex formation protein SpoVR/YcgB (stage V sporulation)
MPKKPKLTKSRRPLYDGADWTFDLVKRAYDEIERIGVGEMGLDIYPNQIEVITSEQMLDAYASTGMPQMYRHWSFGKHFAREEALYRRGHRALAYELVINSNPCINYIMEENSMTMQVLVMAHAAMGHNHFFKNNYLFKQWTDAESILDYMSFAKRYVSECEERYGIEAVEQVLDSAHALMNQGISRHPTRRKARTLARERQRELQRREYEAETYSDLWRTLPRAAEPADGEAKTPESAGRLTLPEENILYFLEKTAPKLEDWQRELLRIVRMMAQYFYPQRQTKMMNEGCATFCHYEILNRLYDEGLIGEGAMLEFLHSHASVIFQPRFEEPHFSGFNPYALGFAITRDIKRIAEEPTPEDREWFPDFAGGGNALGVIKEAWADYRDDSFILQFLSPKVIRDLRLFEVHDKASAPFVNVTAVHDETGYRRVRRALARHYEAAAQDPDLQVVDADISGSRQLVLHHRVRNGVLLDKDAADATLPHLAQLWGFRVRLIEIDGETGKTLKEHEALPMPQ